MRRVYNIFSLYYFYCRKVHANEAQSVLGHSIVNILETSAADSQESIDLLLASAIKVIPVKYVRAHFHYLLVFEGKSSVQFLYYGQVSRGNITTDDSDPSHEKEGSTRKEESVLLVTNVISSKIQYLINVIT